MPIVEALRELHLDVWFDAELNAGDVFSEKIESHLKQARCVLVLWTKDAVNKGSRGWVRSEADWALQRDKLIQAQLEPVKLPPPFFSSVAMPIDLSRLTHGSRKPNDLAWKALLGSVAHFTNRPGLRYLQDSLRSDETLLSWVSRYSGDPLSEAKSGNFSSIAARIRSLRDAEARRIRKRGNLEAELRELVEDTRTAPISYFGASNACIVSDQNGVRPKIDVAEIWPRSASAFAALGLDVNVYGLEFYDLAVERAFDGPTPILVVSGEVRNIGRDDKLVPPVRVSLRDTHSQEIFELVNAISDQPLAAGEAIPFHIRVENPPADVVDLQATFGSFSDIALVDGLVRVSTAPAESQEELLLDQPVNSHAALGGDERIRPS